MASRWRAIPLVALLAVAGLILAGLVAAISNEGRYRQQRQQAATVQADILASSVTAALDFDDVTTATEAVNSLRADASVDVAAVYDETGRLVAGFARNDARRPPVLPREVRPGRGRVAARVPVTQADRALGAVYIESALQPLSQRLSGYWGIGLLVVMGIVVVTVLGVAQAELKSANEKLRREIAERAKAEAALAQAQKIQALGQLTSGIAHDFNNLLTAVVGGLDLILRRSDDEKIRRLAENSIKAAERGTKLTGQLLTFSRSQKLELKPVLVGPLLEGMEELFRRTLGPSIEVELAPDRAPLPVMTDPMQLELAVLNLAINARDAMPDGGRIRIATRAVAVMDDPQLEPGDYVELRVTDTGSGMPPEVVDRAFDPFFTTKGVGKGTGLGLSMVYGLAKQSGGIARIESEPGRGTSVGLLLPAARGAAVAAPPERAQSRPVATTRTGSVMVVDDDADVRAFVVGALEAAGHKVIQADTAAAGLELLRQQRPDVLITDFAMPGMNGAEFAARARDRLPDLPILVISGYADSEALERANASARILRKPFRADQLLAEVDGTLAQAPLAAAT